MLHAVIRSEDTAFHFSAEVDSYNLQMLLQHIRHATSRGRRVQLQIEIDREDELAFAKHTRRWLRGMRAAGGELKVAVLPVQRGTWPPRPQTVAGAA